MSARLRGWLAWLPAAGWASVIFLLSSQPVLPSPPGMSDKLAHAITYGILGAACLFGLVAADWRRIVRRTSVLAVIVAVLYGVSDEFHQAFVPGRTPDVLDVLADAVGAAVAVGVLWLSAILVRRHRVVSRP
jgi:VanZ family protein